MIPFCSNPECQYHKFKVNKKQYSMDVEIKNVRRRVNRHMYVDAEGSEFELCTVCHSAIEMLKSKKRET